MRLLIELVDEFMLLILSSTKSSNDSSFAVKFDNSDSPPFNATGLLSIFVNSDSLFSKAFNILSNSAESGNLAYNASSLLFSSVKSDSLPSITSSLSFMYAVLGRLATSLHSVVRPQSILSNDSLTFLGSTCMMKCLMVSSA